MSAEDLEAFDQTRKWARQWGRRYVEVHPDTADAVWAELERLRGIEEAARSAMFDRPSAPGRDRLRALLEEGQ